MAPKNDPKSTKNRCEKMIEILNHVKTGGTAFLGRPGGMRWPPAGIIGGAKNSLFEIGRCLRHIMALRCTDFGVRSSTPCSAPTGRAADLIASCIPPGRALVFIGSWVSLLSSNINDIHGMNHIWHSFVLKVVRSSMNRITKSNQ